MIDRDTVVDLAPHYLAMLILIFLVLAAIEQVVGRLDFWVEFVIVLAVVTAYRPVVVRLGVAPESWTA